MLERSGPASSSSWRSSSSPTGACSSRSSRPDHGDHARRPGHRRPFRAGQGPAGPPRQHAGRAGHRPASTCRGRRSSPVFAGDRAPSCCSSAWCSADPLVLGRDRARPDPALLAGRGAADLRPRHRAERRDTAGRRPRRPAARRPHARTVVPPVPRGARGVAAVARPGVRWLAAGRRGHRAHRHAGRLADRRASRSTARPSRPTRPAISRTSRRRRTPSRLLARWPCCSSAAAVLQIGRLRRRRPGRTVGEAGASRRRPPAARRTAAACGPPAGGPPPRARRRTSTSRPRHRVRRDVVHRPGRRAVHDRLRQRGPGTPHNVELQRRRRQSVFDGELFNGVEDHGLRRPGPARRRTIPSSVPSIRT